MNQLIFKLGKVDYVTRSVNPAEFGEDRDSSGAPTWWLNKRVACLLFIFFFFSFLDTWYSLYP